MCVAVFLDLKAKNEREREIKSRRVYVRCEETIVPGVWGTGKNQICLHLAINPGKENVDSVYLLAYPRVSGEKPLNDTWPSVDNPFSILFRMVPGRSVEPIPGVERGIKVGMMQEYADAKRMLVGEGVVANAEAKPELIRPIDTDKAFVFSVLKLTFGESLVKDKFNFVRCTYFVHGKERRISIGQGKRVKWPMYGPGRVREKCCSAMEMLQAKGESVDRKYEDYYKLANQGAVEVESYSIQIAVDNRYTLDIDQGMAYDLDETDPNDVNILRQLVPDENQKGFRGFSVLPLRSPAPSSKGYPGLPTTDDFFALVSTEEP